MLQRLLRASIDHPLIVLLLTLASAVAGVVSFLRLPIDAVPDITNNQVQINTLAPSLAPFEVERQVTFAVETALSGIPGLESTRSLSRNAFSQVTAVFSDEIDIYFARNQVHERLEQVRASLPPGAEPQMGPIATGLGEIYMWTVGFDHPADAGAPLEGSGAGWQSDGSYRTPEGERLRTDIERAAYLRTVQDWIIRPQLRSVPGVAGVDSIGGYVKQVQVQPDLARLVGYGLTFHDVIEALERNNVSTGAGFVEHLGEAYVVRASGPHRAPRGDRGDRDRYARGRADPRGGRGRGRGRRRVAHGQRERGRRGGRGRHGRHAARSEQPQRVERGRRAHARGRAHAAARHPRPHGAQPHEAGRRDDPHRRDEPARGSAARHRGLFLLLGNLRAAGPDGSGDPALDAAHRDRHGALWHQRQPDEPRRDRLRADRRRSRDPGRELAAPPRSAPARAGPIALAPRAQSDRAGGQPPGAHPGGVRGRDHPHGLPAASSS
jgi:hypothetical protein